MPQGNKQKIQGNEKKYTNKKSQKQINIKSKQTNKKILKLTNTNALAKNKRKSPNCDILLEDVNSSPPRTACNLGLITKTHFLVGHTY